jgi:glyceraldehyde-3-phosphate dehydrogenase/erythrose-4-phosphate dehydrogenase
MSTKRIYEDRTLNKIEKSQLENSANNVDMTIEKEDCSPNNFSENTTSEHYDQRDGHVVRSNPDFEKFAEMSRFNKEYRIKIEKE